MSGGEAGTERAGPAAGGTEAGAVGAGAGIIITRGEPDAEETAAVVAVALAFARARAEAKAGTGTGPATGADGLPSRPAAWCRPRPVPVSAASWADLAPRAWRAELP